LIIRESAEFASLAAAEGAGVPHVQVCIGMQELAVRMADAAAEPLQKLGALAGLADGQLTAALAGEAIFSLVPDVLDYASGPVLAGADVIKRYHEPMPVTGGSRPPEWGDPERPLIYVTFGSVTASLAPFAGVFREALDALADLEATVLMTVGRKLDPEDLGLVPANARVLQWVPQETVLAHAAAMLGHGGFGTTMGALAAGVPQVVVPLFALDQGINGERVAAVGAGITTRLGSLDVRRGVAELPRLLEEVSYGEAARRIAAALRELPPPAQAVPILTALAGSSGAQIS
jgi:UDP:flavonoid glycosyltransferase YjiC (YdhE family)